MINEKKRNAGIISTNIVGIVLNLILVGFKLTVGFIIHATSIITDGLNNFADSLNSLISIIGTKLSGKKPTRKHPFGFGRFEYITSTIIGIVILVVGALAIKDSIESIIEYYTTRVLADFNLFTIIMIGVAIAIKLIMALIYRINAKRFDSMNLKALSADSFFDALLSTATLIAAIVGMVWGFYIEGYVGILIGGFIIKSGVEVLIEAMGHLLGKRVDEELSKQIKQDILSINGVSGVYDLILNNYGHDKYIGSVHVGVSNEMDAHEVQELERAINILMYTKYKIIMTTGIYAKNKETKDSKEIYTSLMELVKDNSNILQVHGFFVDEKDGYVNFDLVFSFDEKDPKSIVESIKKNLEEKHNKYVFIINIDYDYS